MEQEVLASSSAFDSSLGRMLFVINQVNLENRPKRLLVAQPTKLSAPAGSDSRTDDQNFYTVKENEGRLNQGGTFASKSRFEKLPKDVELPFHHKLGEVRSEFRDASRSSPPRGVLSFGKPRESVSLMAYSVPRQMSAGGATAVTQKDVENDDGKVKSSSGGAAIGVVPGYGNLFNL